MGCTGLGLMGYKVSGGLGCFGCGAWRLDLGFRVQGAGVMALYEGCGGLGGPSNQVKESRCS